MSIDMLIIFILIAVILFILTVFIMDDSPMLAIPFIFAGMIFSVICTYGFFNVETFYIGQNVTTGNLAPYMYTDDSYALVYPWVFFFMFLLYVILFVRVGFNVWKESLETKGEMKYKKR